MTQPYYQSIVNALQSVDRDGSYASGGIISMPLPTFSLTSQPDLILGLPLCNADIQQFMSKARKAGNERQMFINPSIHGAWQLNESQFTIKNSEWEKSMCTLLTRLKTELGCDKRITVSCELCKLLLYTPGGFCKVSVVKHYTRYYLLTSCGGQPFKGIGMQLVSLMPLFNVDSLVVTTVQSILLTIMALTAIIS